MCASLGRIDTAMRQEPGFTPLVAIGATHAEYEERILTDHNVEVVTGGSKNKQAKGENAHVVVC